MGECLLARGAGGSGASKDPLDDIPVVAGYCSILVTLKDSGGGLCSNMMVNCKDGTKWYNYKTNEQGMALFQCNSGSANFNCPNYYNDGSRLIYMADQANTSLNVDAPVGTKMSKEIIFSRLNNFNSARFSSLSFPQNINVTFRDTTKITNLIMIGGGGRGASGYYTDPNGTGWRSTEYAGGGGGGGAKNYAASVAITKNQVYYLSLGWGGGYGGITASGAGATASGFGYSANGGSAGSANVGGAGGVGLYNGGKGGNGWYEIGGTGTNYAASAAASGTNGAGGGGGGGGLASNGERTYTSGASNGGGRGAGWNSDSVVGTNFSGGGGGGGSSNFNANYPTGKVGGHGRITFNM